MPRNMRFGPSNATSIDLCVHDLILASRYREETRILCCENETLFSGLDIVTYPPSTDRHKARKIKFALGQAKARAVDLIVVQQHLPTAAAVARRSSTPVILHKHNLTKPTPATGFLNRLKRIWRIRQHNALAGIIFVSEACKDAFRADWPEITAPMAVVYNGLDFRQWNADGPRRNEIICVGRAAPEKGIKEAAEAVVSVLKTEPSWSARFVLSESHRFANYLRLVTETLQPLADRVSIELDQTLPVVRRRLEEAAIAIVPSRWEEPFGRTALEAHAAGCAVISSGTGGLKEVSGGHAVLLPERFTAGDIAEKLNALIGDGAKREAIAREGRAYCERRFALDEISASADRFYEQICKQVPRKAA
ncbi:MAG: glycosyltransferase family 4 protein [Hyphomicrobium sp.]|uniref:glycosyltransferase family 4 protein n=1 Tax=Hyphomicrobium sp. TaxID=82 RepID=UPI0039E54DEE